MNSIFQKHIRVISTHNIKMQQHYTGTTASIQNTSIKKKSNKLFIILDSEESDECVLFLS